MRPDLRQRYKPLIWGAAAVFLLLGVLGLFLPFLQGILFLLVGFYLISLVSPRGRIVRMRLKRRYPRLAAGLHKAEEWLKVNVFRRASGR